MKKKTLGVSLCILLLITTITMTNLFTDLTVHTRNPKLISLNIRSEEKSVDRLGDEPANQSPIFTSPIPENNSVNNALKLTWSILINDTEGDPFNWTIECNNGQQNKSSGASNGTKSVLLSELSYDTTYRVWVNATDPTGSGEYHREWYYFTTKENLPPYFETPIPANGSVDQPLSFIWSISIKDPEGDKFSWTIECSNDQQNNSNGASNGTKLVILSELAYLTTYIVWVNATDPAGSGEYHREWYNFTTKGSLPPVFGTPSPINTSKNNPLDFTWSIPINDPEGDLFSWSIQCNNSQNSSGTGATNGTQTLALSGLAYSTTYTVWVNATDTDGSGLYTRRWYNFTTKELNTPPIFQTPNPSNGSINQPLGFTWSIWISDAESDPFSWTIQCNNSQTSSGTGATNGTKSLALSGLAYSTTYVMWVNATDLTGSGLYTRSWFTFTTKANLPPVFSTPTPADKSIVYLLSFTWVIPITDPEGDTFSWTIQCSNGQNSGATSASNGTKSLALTNLSYLKTYRVWVNATDPFGSNTSTRKWYDFTVREPDGGGGSVPPVPPVPTNKNPIADASAGEPYQGFINSPILFDGSNSYDPDGTITKWLWVFGDNTNATGRLVNHTYTIAKSYLVILTVTDNEGATNTIVTTCVVKQINSPPSTPTITGLISGTKNTLYTYTATSTDLDNDPLNFTFDWGDTTDYSSGFLVNVTSCSVNHSWTAAGRYNLNVTVRDNHSKAYSKIVVYIDAIQTRGAGYLLDNDSDGIYDAFYSDETYQMIAIQKKDDNYLIDKDRDGDWDYMYNTTYGLTLYQESQGLPGFEMISTIGAMICILLWRRKKFWKQS